MVVGFEDPAHRLVPTCAALHPLDVNHAVGPIPHIVEPARQLLLNAEHGKRIDELLAVRAAPRPLELEARGAHHLGFGDTKLMEVETHTQVTLIGGNHARGSAETVGERLAGYSGVGGRTGRQQATGHCAPIVRQRHTIGVEHVGPRQQLGKLERDGGTRTQRELDEVGVVLEAPFGQRAADKRITGLWKLTGVPHETFRACRGQVPQVVRLVADDEVGPVPHKEVRAGVHRQGAVGHDLKVSGDLKVCAELPILHMERVLEVGGQQQQGPFGAQRHRGQHRKQPLATANANGAAETPRLFEVPEHLVLDGPELQGARRRPVPLR